MARPSEFNKGSAIAVSLVLVGAYAFANWNDRYYIEKPPYNECSENPMKSFFSNPDASSPTMPCCEEIEVIQPEISPTPSSMVLLNDHCWAPFFTADYLLWTARQDNMSYSYPLEEFSGTSTTVKSKVHYPDYDWSAGFRVGAGLNFEHDGWDTYLNYTWFHPSRAKGHEHLHSDADSLVPTWSMNLPGHILLSPDLISAKSRWGFEFYNLDWELGRNYYISRFLTLRPYFGLQSAWQKQKLSLTFDTSQLANGLTGGIATFAMKNKQDYWGIGALVGLDSAWYVYKKNLSLIGDLAVSALWGDYQHIQKQYEVLIDDTSNLSRILVVNFRDSFHAIKPVLKFDIGMQWEQWFHCDRRKFSIQALWEEQIWINQNTLPEAMFACGVPFFGPNLQAAQTAEAKPIQYGRGGSSTYKARGGDLYLQGLTLRVRFDF